MIGGASRCLPRTCADLGSHTELEHPMHVQAVRRGELLGPQRGATDHLPSFEDHNRALEIELLLEFQQGAHQSSGFVPLFNEVLDWLALMQHYGAPTRLLDWTRSPYVALYFALEKADKESAVWAINREWLENKSTGLIREHDQYLTNTTWDHYPSASVLYLCIRMNI